MSYKNNIGEMTRTLLSLCEKKLSEKKHIIITGHDCPDSDSLISSYLMKCLLCRAGIEATVRFATQPDRVSAENAKWLCFYDEIEFGNYSSDDAILIVDHHKSHFDSEFDVFGCVDHHTTPPLPEYEYNFVEYASSCGKIIYDMMCTVGFDNGESEKLALYSVYLDTQSCKSSKFNSEDSEWVENTLEKYNIDRAHIEKMGYCYNDFRNSTVSELALCGFKKYKFFGYTGISACIQSAPEDIGTAEQMLRDIFKYLALYMKENDIFMCAYVLNVPEKKHSDIYFVTPGKDEENFIFKKVSLDRLASRSRDVVPVVYKVAKERGDKNVKSY